MPSHRSTGIALTLACAVLMSACAAFDPPPPSAPAPVAALAPEPEPVAPPPPPPPPPPPSVLELAARPAEQNLLGGIRAYEDGQYAHAEHRLQQALRLGLASNKDRAGANKYLAFVYCSNRRISACEAAFRAARAADPGFSLSKAEAGHPVWGPVYRRVSQAPRS